MRYKRRSGPVGRWPATALPRSFYARETTEVAVDLLGKRLLSSLEGGTVSGIITETEAYGHLDDPASHACRRMTQRNRAMFGEVGMAYVYFTYGMHYCFNVVARPPRAEAGAVLVRAVSPDSGIDTMKANRHKDTTANLANGPAKLAQAMGITTRQYGEDLTVRGGIWIEEGRAGPLTVASKPRVGVSDTREWNFSIG